MNEILSASYKNKIKMIQSELTTLANTFDFTIFFPVIKHHSELKDDSTILLLCVELQATNRITNRSIPLKIPWIVYLSFPYHFPKIHPNIKWAFHKGEEHPFLDSLNSLFKQAIHSTCCIMTILEKLIEIFVDQSIPNITTMINNITVLVRDYGYDTINQQHWGKSSPTELVNDYSRPDKYTEPTHIVPLRLRRAIALYDYDCKNVDDQSNSHLSVKQGDQLLIIDQPKDGWLIISKLNDQDSKGFIPERFVVHF